MGILILLIVTSFVLARLSRVAILRWKLARSQQADLFGFIGDVLFARKDLFVLNETQWSIKRTQKSLDDLYVTTGRAYIGGRAFWPITQLFIAFAFGLGFAYGIHELSLGKISVGTIMALYLYVDLLQKPLEDTSSLAGQLQEMAAVFSITAQNLSYTPDLEENTQVLPKGPLSLAFENVSFTYNSKNPVLTNVTFKISANHKLGIIGRTGAGKSTIINLMCGLMKPNEGKIFIGGVEATKIPADEFANRVAVLNQRAHIFAASVRENLCLFADNISDQEIWYVLTELNAAPWVKELPQGLDTQIGTGGRLLSKGEMQLLTGARALLKKQPSYCR